MASGEQHIKHIWVITGPAGCGKTTVGKHLAQNLQLPYLEGDDFHKSEHVERMKSGIPLEDADRWDWLIRLRESAIARIRDGNPGVIVACSALKRRYRDVLRIATYFRNDIAIHFVALSADEDLLIERVKAREDHYMDYTMVRSQLASLEKPDEDEWDCFPVDVSGTSVKVLENTIRVVKSALQKQVIKTHAETA